MINKRFILVVVVVCLLVPFVPASAGEAADHEVEVVEEHWSDGELRERRHVTRLDDGRVVEHGSLERWYADGTKEYEATFVLGKKDGSELRFHRNGELASSRTYRLGERHGTSVGWDAAGNKVKQEEWSEDRPHGRWTIWSKGRVEWAHEFAHGKPGDTISLPPEPDGPKQHVETPRDPYLPTPTQPHAPAAGRTLVSRDGFVSTQVNVDGLGGNVIGDAANEPSIAVDPTDSTKMVIGWRQFDNITSDFRQAGNAYTTDGGNTWTFPGPIEPGVFRSDPVLNADADGVIYYNSLTADAGPSNFRCHVFKSFDGGVTWDAGTFAFGGDKQWQIIDQTAGIGAGNIYVAWNSFFSACSGGFTHSYDGGATWEPCTVAAGDPQWGTLAVGPDGELYLSGTGMTLSKSTTLQDSNQPTAWDFSTTVNLGGSLEVSTGPNPAGLLGQNWVDVDRSDGPTRGNVYMLASVDPTSGADPMDVMFSRSEDGGVTWSAPVRVNDDPGTSAWQWFGTMSVAPNGRIDAVWLDTRNDPGGAYQSELFYSSSEDAGVTWSPNVALTPGFDPHLGWPQQNKMGDYFHMISDDFGANLAFAATFNGEQDVYFARIGDPACPDDGRVSLDRGNYACSDVVEIDVLDCGLNTDDGVVEQLVVSVDSDTESGFKTLALTETHGASALFEGTIAVSEIDGSGVLQINEGDTLTVTYVDADDGLGNTNVQVTAQATIDCSPPLITNVQALNVTPIGAEITFATDEPTSGVVHYGLSCDALTATAAAGSLSASPSISLTGLTENTTWFFTVEALDEAGNVSTDDNGGTCFSFTTPDVPNYFTELFASGIDLEGLRVTFTPNGSIDFYSACVEPITGLPTDPTGGTDLGLGDDTPASFVLGGGASVQLYGQAYDEVFVSPNGYVTLDTGDSDYTETLEDHFDQARVAALWDDLNPSSAGTVSWLQTADRVAVTWQGVVEHSTSNANTFQIELFFDGTIAFSWLEIGVTDALAGLSDGGGLPPVFYPSDLSEQGACGPRPPVAISKEVNTDTGTPVTIALDATDDGLPEDPGALTWTIVTLPADGYLEDLGAGSIVGVPHTLAGGGNQVLFVPTPGNTAADSFDFAVDDGGIAPEGGGSNIATVSVTQGGPQVIFDLPFDVDPGWTTEGQWAFGQPTGGGTHDLDPTSGATGDNVYGYNLSGDYSNNMALETLTSKPFDLSAAAQTQVEFRRWLGVESSSYDHASFQVSADGVSWTTIWDHSGSALSESDWSTQLYDISAVADGEPAVLLRWTMGTTDGSVTYPGWNIDDVKLYSFVADGGCSTAPDEVESLFVHADKQTLDWLPPAALGGTEAPVYDVLRSGSATDFTSATLCIESDDGSNSYAADGDAPAPGQVFHYLVRAENSCGAGSLGLDSSGAERSGAVCPAP
ncbi:MAG: hypothetical protein GY716_17660 [bacterium]|nr:hypothetical protein [bacterium]